MTLPAPDAGEKKPRHMARPRAKDHGFAQLSLIEHALCPLDRERSLVPGFQHQATYHYMDKHRHLLTANAEVHAPFGLSANDEFYLWGLLALTFSEKEPEQIFTATPHFCLRQLGCVDTGGDRGGRDYRHFRQALKRLAAVHYANNAFWDPIRGEHRDVSFGFLSFSLPLDVKTSRAWRFAWNPLFFEFVQAAGGAMSFDLETYRDLDFASRRLFLLLKKIFWRQPESPAFDVRRLAVETLGFAPEIEVCFLKRKVGRCLETLARLGVIALPAGASPQSLFEKRAKGEYAVRLTRGPYFDRRDPARQTADVRSSPHYDVLHAIGFDDQTIRRLLGKYRSGLIREWADITLAARERNGETFFKNSAQAYFIDNITTAAAGRRSPPDWWRAMRREEEFRREDEARQARGSFAPNADQHFDEYLRTEAKAAFEQTMEKVFTDLSVKGETRETKDMARHVATMHFWNRFKREHPEFADLDRPQRLSEFRPRDI